MILKQKFIVARDVVFDEAQFPFDKISLKFFRKFYTF